MATPTLPKPVDAMRPRSAFLSTAVREA